MNATRIITTASANTVINTGNHMLYSADETGDYETMTAEVTVGSETFRAVLCRETEEGDSLTLTQYAPGADRSCDQPRDVTNEIDAGLLEDIKQLLVKEHDEMLAC